MRRWILVVAMAFGLSGCATLQQLAALRHVEFRLAGIGGLAIAGIDLGQKRSLDDFGVLDAARLTAAFVEGRLPLAMLVDVEAENPADNASSARFLAMDWTLRLEDTDTVSGRVNEAMTLNPGVPATIPVQVEMDLLDFFERSLGDLVNLAAGLTGLSSASTQVELMVLPTIETPLGPMHFPEPVRVVRKSVGS